MTLLKQYFTVLVSSFLNPFNSTWKKKRKQKIPHHSLYIRFYLSDALQLTLKIFLQVCFKVTLTLIADARTGPSAIAHHPQSTPQGLYCNDTEKSKVTVCRRERVIKREQ